MAGLATGFAKFSAVFAVWFSLGGRYFFDLYSAGFVPCGFETKSILSVTRWRPESGF